MEIVRGVIYRPVKAVIYGSEGIGKSTLASKAPDPLFIDLEGGTAQLDVRRIAPPETWDGLMTIVRETIGTPGICKTLVIDTADWAERLCINYICTTHKKASLESFGYGAGYTILQEEFSRLLELLNQVIAAGMNVIIVAHAKLRKQELPDQAGAFDRWELKLTRQVAPLLKEWCDALLFCNYKVQVVETGQNSYRAKGGKRVCYTSHNPTWDAKNRHGLPEVIDMDFAKIAHLFVVNNPNISMVRTPQEQLRALLDYYHVTEEEIQAFVSDKNHDHAGMAIDDYDDDFIVNWIIRYWRNILPLIRDKRS